MKRRPITTVKVHDPVFAALKAVSIETGIPVTRLITFAVKAYFAEKYSHIKIEEKK